MKKRILTGIQVTGNRPHLGNILGAVLPAIKLSEKEGYSAFYFIADLHSLTQIKNKSILIKNTYNCIAALLSLGLDYKKNFFYKQSDISEVLELAWYFSCIFPYNRLQLAHSFKDKKKMLTKVNVGLFTYPILMASDILLHNPDLIPVGKDQLQHIEMTRDIANTFNRLFGNTFKLPEASISENKMLIPGLDGLKMSKSRNNVIDIFSDEKVLKKQIFSIITDTTPITEPLNYNNCTVFRIYSVLASKKQVEIMKDNYNRENYGFGHAKKELLGLILDKYSNERKVYKEIVEDRENIDYIMKIGADKVREKAKKKLSEVRQKIGYSVRF